MQLRRLLATSLKWHSMTRQVFLACTATYSGLTHFEERLPAERLSHLPRLLLPAMSKVNLWPVQCDHAVMCAPCLQLREHLNCLKT